MSLPYERRVVITGIGVIAPNGIGKEAFWQGLKSGLNCVDNITFFDATEHPSKVAAEIRNFKAENYVPLKKIKKMDRSTHMGIAAGLEAIADSKLPINDKTAPNIGCIIGTGAGGMGFAEHEMSVYFKEGLKKVNPYAAISVFCGAIPAEIAIQLGIKGPNIAVSNGCTSSNDAIGLAFNTIKAGTVDAVLTGGVDACVTPAIVGSFCRINALSTKRNHDPKKASRPFNLDRDGFVMSEGAWLFVFEELQSALKRGAHIYAEMVGYGSTCDAYHMTAPAPDSKQTAHAMQVALKTAGLAPEKIDIVVAHGTSTPLNDKNESQAIKIAFGDHAREMSITSIKSMIGHAVGAAAAGNFVTAIMATKENFIPPTINYENPDPECDLDYTPNKGKKLTVNYALVNSIGFGAKNASTIVKKYQE